MFCMFDEFTVKQIGNDRNKRVDRHDDTNERGIGKVFFCDEDTLFYEKDHQKCKTDQ